MAPTLVKALSLLSFASLAFQGVAAHQNYSSTSICATSSKCIPFAVDVSLGQAGAPPRQAILTNGTLPGPPLKMKVGDCVDFVVTNNLPYGTSVHFHGIRQLGTPWADGAAGLSQTPIAPGSSYMYQWTAVDSGTYFYHAHYKGQMMDGMFGAIVIQPADDAQTPFSQISSSSSDVKAISKAAADLETVFIGDWSQFTFEEFFNIEKTANIDDACTDSIILNGQGSVYCPGVAALTAVASPLEPLILGNSSLTAKGCVPPFNPLVQGNYTHNLATLPPGAYDQCTPYSGKNYTYNVDAKNGWAAMSFINSGGFLEMLVTIDSHKLYIYEVDGHYITPQVVDQIAVAAGDRVTFAIKLDQPAANYQIRVANSGLNQVISGFGVLSYKGASGFGGVAVMNYGGVNTTTITALDRFNAPPFPSAQVSQNADKTFILDIMKSPSDPLDDWAWTLSGVQSYNRSRDDANPPLLFQNPSSIPPSDLILRTNYNQWVDLVINIAGPLAEPHPIHKHGNKFYAIGAGLGNFSWTSVAAAQAAGVPFNLQNPPYVDGFTSIPAQGNSSWMVFRYQANTPGAWFLHCHVQTHFSGGMAVAILDAVDKFPVVPSDVGKVCPGHGSSGWGSGYGSGSGSGSGSNGSGGSGGFYTTTGAGYPTATSSGPATYTNGSIATFTGAAALLRGSWASAGLLAIFAAVYA